MDDNINAINAIFIRLCPSEPHIGKNILSLCIPYAMLLKALLNTN